jgi:hypothetical protein
MERGPQLPRRSRLYDPDTRAIAVTTTAHWQAPTTAHASTSHRRICPQPRWCFRSWTDYAHRTSSPPVNIPSTTHTAGTLRTASTLAQTKKRKRLAKHTCRRAINLTLTPLYTASHKLQSSHLLCTVTERTPPARLDPEHITQALRFSKGGARKRTADNFLVT